MGNVSITNEITITFNGFFFFFFCLAVSANGAEPRPENRLGVWSESYHTTRKLLYIT